MAVDVSRIPNNNKFDPVREAILQLQTEIEDTGAAIGNGTLTINTSGALTGSGTFTANQTGPSTITIGLDDSSYLTEEVNDLTAAVTWANVPDANITESSVTQHQAALSITESQISDLQSYLVASDLDDYLLLTETGTQTIAGSIVISGDLTISGTTTYINTNHLNIGDNIIQLNADIGGTTAPTEDAGFYVNRGSSPDASFLWDEGDDRFSTYANALATASLYIGSNQVINASRQFIGSSTISSTVPYFTFSGDTNTGVGRATNNMVSLIADGTKVLEANNTGVDITGTLDVSGSITGNGIVLTDDIITSANFTTASNRFKLILTKADTDTIEASLDDVVLSSAMDANYVPYVTAAGGDGSSTNTNAVLSESWLKINSDTLELGASDPVSHEVRYARFLWQSGSNDKISTVYGARDISATINYLGGSASAKIAFTTGTGAGRIRFNDAFTFPASDGSSGQVLGTNGSGDLSWVSGAATTSDLQDVTNNGAITTNNITIEDADLFLNRSSVNGTANRRIRFTEDIDSSAGYQGGYIYYNGDSNLFQLGTHNATGTNSANDVYAIQMTRGTGNVEVNNNITAAAFVKRNGTSSQFLKADGSVDSNSYALSSIDLQDVTDNGATTTNSVTVGDGTANNSLVVKHSDNSRVEIHGYGIEMSRGASYIRPTSDASLDLYVGNADASYDWRYIYFKYDNSVQFYKNGTQTLQVGSNTNIASGSLQMGSTTVIDSSRNIFVPDNSYLKVGTGEDLRIWHNATNSYIDNYTGGLLIRNHANDQDIMLATDNGTGGNAAYILCDGAVGDVKLYYASGGSSSLKFQTTSSGVEVTGTLGVGITPASGYSLDVAGLGKFDTAVAINGVDTGNPTPTSNEIRVSGYGIIGNRGTFYVTNASGGTVQIGNGSSHNANPAAYFNSTSISLLRNTAVTGYITATSATFQESGTGGSTTVSIQHAGTTGSGILDLQSASAPSVIQSDTDLQFKTSGSARLHIEDTGNVGIGTTTPSEKLSVNGTFSSNAIWTSSSAVTFWGAYSTAYGVLTWDSSYAKIYAVGGKELHLAANGASADVVIDTSGNVGIGTTSPSYRLQVMGNARVSTQLVVNDYASLQSGILDNGNKRILIPEGAAYTTQNSSVTGAIKISLPLSRFKSNSMMTFKVVIYEYVTGKTHEYRIGGYNYSDAGANWYNQSAINLTDDGDNYTVRFGNDGTRQCVWIGEVTDNWTYPQIHITDVTIGYAGNSVDWHNDWQISFVTSFDTVSKSRTPARIGRNMLIDSLVSTGNVGIGTTTPSEKLEVQGAVRSLEFIADGGAANNGYDFASSGSSASVANMFCPSGYTLAFGTNNSERMRIDASGRVGIGTTTPAEKLHVYSTGTTVSLLEGSTDAFLHVSAGSTINDDSGIRFQRNKVSKWGLLTLGDSGLRLYDYVSGSDHTYFQAGGNVGIGTTSPAYPLDVNGSIRGGSYRIGGGTVLSGLSTVLVGSGGATSAVGLVTTSGQGLTLNGGNVGIGTTSPNTKLNINGSSAHLNFTGSNNRILFNGYRALEGSHDGNLLQVGESYSNVIIYGNVGIGTTAPSYKLDVVGEGNFSSFLNVNAGYGIRSTGWVHLQRYASNLKVAVGNNGTNVDLIVPNGSVGIGTNSPSDKLTVVGDTYLNGKVGIGITPTTTWDLRIKGQYPLGLQDSSGVATFEFYADLKENRYLNGSKIVGYNQDLSIDTTSSSYDILLANNGGNVGIGTTTPSAKLEVQSSDTIKTAIHIDNTSTNGNRWDIASLGVDTGIRKGNLQIRNDSDSLNIIEITSSGSVGIGTTAPIGKLEISTSNVRTGVNGGADELVIQNNDYSGITILSSAAAAGQIHFGDANQSNTGMIQYFHSDNSMRFATGNSSEKVRIDSSGNVGIGTTSPSYKLEVVGDGRYSGDLYVEGNQVFLNNIGARTKLMVWSGSTYGIGMQTTYTYGHLNDYAMTFQMSNTSTRGFWWGDASHTNAQGAMSLTTTGKLTVATSLNVGYGESVTSPSETNTLMVNGSVGADNIISSAAFSVASNRFKLVLTTQDSNTIEASLDDVVLSNQLDSGFVPYTTTSGGNGDTTNAILSDSFLKIVGSTLQLDWGDTVGVYTERNLTMRKDGGGFGQYYESDYQAGQITFTHYDSSGIDTASINSTSNGSLELNADANINLKTAGSSRFYIDSTGNVGIGTTSPSEKLQVEGGNIRFLNSMGTAGNFDQCQLRIATNNAVNTTGWQGMRFETSTAANYGWSFGVNRSSGGRGSLRFYEHVNSNAGTERFTIQQDGNVGINDSTPSYKLDVNGTGRFTEAVGINSAPDTGSAGSYLKIQGGSTGFKAFRILGGAYSSIGEFEFGYNGAGVIVINNAGYNSAGMSFKYGTSTVGSISINSASTSYNTTSDYRLKENVAPISDGIDRLKQLKPSRFNFIGHEEVVDGFIAHEAQTVVPEAVSGEKDAVDFEGNPDYQGIDQSKLVPLLTAALQEAVAKIEALEQRISNLENQ